jgi:hypothetical protein
MRAMGEKLETIAVGRVRLNVIVVTNHDDKGGWWATTEGLMVRGGPQPAAFSSESESEAVSALKKAVSEGLLSGVIEMIKSEASQN